MVMKIAGSVQKCYGSATLDESMIFCNFFSLLGVLESRPDTEGDSEPGSGL